MNKARRELLNPPGWPLLLAGGFLGLVAGVFSLSESPENATAIGIALFVGISVGGWLGATAIKVLNSFFVRVYRNSDAKLVKSREDLSCYFADVLPAVVPENQVGSMAAQRSRDAMTNFSSSLNVFRSLGHTCIYLYPIAGVITFAEVTTLGLLAVGGLEIPTTISVLSFIGRITGRIVRHIPADHSQRACPYLEYSAVD